MGGVNGSGAGAFGAGLGPAGHDVPDAFTTRAVQDPAPALYFDPYDRVWLQNADLTMVAGSPNIQRAAVLMLPRGSIPSTASSGIDVARIKAASPAQRTRVISDELKAAWKVLLEAGKIALDGVDVEPTPRGGQWSGRFYPRVRDLEVKSRAVTLEGKV